MAEVFEDLDMEEAKKQAQHFGIDFVSLRGVEIPYDVLTIIPEDIARKSQLVIYKKDNEHLFIAIADPKKLKEKAPEILTKLKKEQGYNFTIAVTTKDDLAYALLGYKQKKDIEQKPKEAEIAIKPSSEPKLSTSPVFDAGNKAFSLKSIGKIPYEVLNKFPRNIADKYRMIVFFESPDTKDIKVAVENPDNLQTQEILDFISKRNNIQIEKVKATPEDIDWALGLYDLVPEPQAEKEIKPVVEKPEKKKKEDFFIKPAIKIKPKEEIKEAEKPTLTIEKIGPEPKNLTIKTVSASEEEQDLDLMIPEGINDDHDLEMAVKSGSIPKTVSAFLYYAAKLGASDVHIESNGENLLLRYRIDGILRIVLKMPVTLHAPIISRIKILAKLKIDEQRIPQDGRIDIKVMGKEIDLRVSTLPTIHGEKVVMRLLDKTTGLIPLEKLGLIGENKRRLEEAIKKPFGIIFSTGPTGSGKTTTLYAILNTLNKPSVNIVTLEDPVEYELPGINQCQIKPKIGFDFANGLRSILRQDPNIIMVGEVRDSETANMATHAALTGHLVLSTLHTNDSAGALPRLIDMGVEPFLITSSINIIIAQRLVRRLCDECKKPTEIPEKIAEKISQAMEKVKDPELKKAFENRKFYKAVGCDKCKDGYKGRLGLYEALSITDRIEQLAVSRATATAIKRAAINEGLITLRDDGYAKASMGMTTIDEVIRVTNE